jgi:hypothetical protein
MALYITHVRDAIRTVHVHQVINSYFHSAINLMSDRKTPKVKRAARTVRLAPGKFPP